MSLVFSSEPVPRQDVFLFCLKPDMEPLSISRSESSFLVNNDDLNYFFSNNGISNIEKWIPQATEIDRDGDIYLNRIYRVYIEENYRNSIDFIINSIQGFSFVLYAENEFERKPLYTPNDNLVELQCSLSSQKADKAWDFWDIPNGLVPDGTNVLLASVDTGVDYTHPDIQDNSWINQGEIPSFAFESGIDENSDGYVSAPEVVLWMENQGMDVNADGEINLRDAVSDGSPFEDGMDSDGNGYADDILGWDCSGYYGTDDNDPFPKEDVANNGTWAHGTHVAGILAATTDNDLGMASVAYNSKYISVKCSRENQSGEPGISDGYAGITYAAKAGMYAGSFAIINNSWGGGGYSASENSVINNAQNTYGAIVLASAGNGYDSGGEQYGAHYPSSYDNCISVCAIGCSGQWGNWATYHYTVDLAAPGESIYSTIIGSGYEAWDGSSMACPNAASAIGLLSAYHPSWDNMQLRGRIESSADRRIYELNPEYETCNGNSGEDCLGSGLVDVYKAIGLDFSPNISIYDLNVDVVAEDDPSTLIDGDSVLNPGESATIYVQLENELGWVDASNLTAYLSTENEYIQIDDDLAVYGSLQNGSIDEGSFEISVSEMADLGEIEFNLSVQATGVNYDYENNLSFNIDISLFQEGFPYDINTEVRASSVVADLDNDNNNELIFADYGGFIHVIKDGIEIENDSFPFETGDQIWGSVSSADIDLDGYVDFAVSSKSGSLYVFDINGLKFEYNAERWLIATPVIGNIDDDEELEIIVGGYQSPTSSSPLFAVNHDGTDVDGFPYVVGEKMKSGVALADMDGNGRDDIIFGTDGDNLYVLMDDLTVAPGFPIDLGQNIQSEPSVLNLDGELIIFSGCKNNNFYAINYSDASIRFVIPTGDDVFTSPSYYDGLNGVEIYFGSDDGNIYGIDNQGNSLDGFPINVGGAIVGSIVLSDLNNDSIVDLVAATDGAQLHAYDRTGVALDYFPINYEFPFSGSPMIVDFDGDDDLEIVCGTTGDIMMIDVKNSGGNSNYWSLFKGDNARTGYYISEGDGNEWDCPVAQTGDLNCDAIINILDIVTMVNMVVGGTSSSSEYQIWAADMNADGIINVLDIVQLVNIVVSQ